MAWELDHVFLASADAAAAEAALAEFGIAFTDRRVHRGQGTANACAVFDNAFFELLFPADTDELRSDVVRPLGLYERIHWLETGACPFGICFRPGKPGLDDVAGRPFETWAYTPAYLRAGESIPIVTPPHRLHEPLVFLLTRPRPAALHLEAPLHRGARRTLTSVAVRRTARSASISDGVRWFAEHGLLALSDDTEDRLELEWDGGRAGQRYEFPASVPVAFRW